MQDFFYAKKKTLFKQNVCSIVKSFGNNIAKTGSVAMIKAEMVTTLEDMKVFARKANTFKTFIIVNAILALFALWMLVLFCISIAYGAKILDNMSLIVLFAFAVAYVIHNFTYNLKTIPKNNLKKIKDAYGDTPVSYTFFEEYFNVKVENGINSEDSNLEYKNLHSAIETDEHYFIYLAKAQAHVIRKNSFVDGTPEELSALFKEKLGSRFTIKN